MLKLSGLLGILFVCLGVEWFEYFGTDIIQGFLILQAYIIFTLFCTYKLSDNLLLKAISLYSGIFWILSFITDCFLIDCSLILTAIVALPLYILSAKNIVKSPITPMLDFKHNYIIENVPFKWYQWLWLLVGKNMSAYNWYYNSDKGLLMRIEDGILIERKVSHQLLLKELKATGADVSIAKVSYKSLQAKLGKKINCKKEIYWCQIK